MERVMKIWYGNRVSRRKARIILTVKYPLWDFSVAASRPDRSLGIKFVCFNVHVADAELPVTADLHDSDFSQTKQTKLFSLFYFLDITKNRKLRTIPWINLKPSLLFGDMAMLGGIPSFCGVDEPERSRAVIFLSKR